MSTKETLTVKITDINVYKIKEQFPVPSIVHKLWGFSSVIM